jgi:hypothetical protein
MKLAFELDVPDGAVDKSAEAELVRSVKEQTVLKLYSEQRITTGEAAEMGSGANSTRRRDRLSSAC